MGPGYRFILIFFAVILLILGFIFLIGSAGLIINIAIGTIMIVVACGFFLIVYKLEHTKAAQPKLVSQTVTVDLSGEKTVKELECKNCGAKLSNKDIGMISGGVIVKCSYCSSIYELEEKPKW